MVIHRYLLLVLFLGIISQSGGQDIYYVTPQKPGTISRYDLSDCNPSTPIELSGDIDLGTTVFDISFHPNGRMYIITDKYLLQYDFTSRSFKIIGDASVFFNGIGNIPGLAVDEEGRFIVSGGGERDGRHYAKEFDLRSGQVLQEYYSDDLVYYFIGRIKDYFIPIPRAEGFHPDSSGFWVFDLVNNKPVKYFDWGQDREYPFQLLGSSVLYEPCDSYTLVNSAVYPHEPTRQNSHHILYPETGEVKEICDESVFYLGSGTPTDFRQSPLRIDLDADNSNGHITAGYYDTLTTCQKEVPVMDEDIEISTCGAEVDYFSFRLKYYDAPRLPEELIYSEGFSDPVKTSPGRYVWQNTYGADEDKIKEYLSSLRYRADPGGQAWSDPDERERVVMTTMHVGEDSTTSWSVYQLERDEVFAGRDSTITYCPEDGVSLELTDFLSAGVSLDGRIEPVLSGGGTVFTPGTDADGDYLYILEKMDCADTAVLTIESLETGLEDLALDTVTVCPGQQARIGFPPGKYESIEWWDGSTGDSIWIGADALTDYYVLVNQGYCGIRIPITVLEQDVAGSAGRDTTIRYCGGGTVMDLTKILGLPDEYSYEITPALNNGSLVFDPVADTAGSYLIIAGEGSCTDTAAVVLEETTTQELVLDPVRLCAGTTQRIGLEPGIYDQVTWWNGDSGDSTTVSDNDSGPYTVEARQNGCIYQGVADITVLPEVVLPDNYPDQMILCEGDPPQANRSEKITVSGLNSILWENNYYYPGEEITITGEGEYTVRGYLGGCFSDKIITVEIVTDPSVGYQQTIDWCPQSLLTISLPEDNSEWRFQWADGTASTSRQIDSTGRFSFLILSDSCEYTGYYDVIEGTDCDEECTVSLPNAVTPNGDGINDNLEVFSDCPIRIIDVRVFDKWGGELYHVQDGVIESRIWENLPPGVVMVQVTYETMQGLVKTVAGGIMVIK